MEKVQRLYLALKQMGTEGNQKLQESAQHFPIILLLR